MTSERQRAQSARSTRHRTTDSRVRPSDVADEQGNVSDILIASFKM